jgi:predicted O-methyltransferase YrrM
MAPPSSAFTNIRKNVSAVREEGGLTAVVSRASKRTLAPVWIRFAARRLEQQLQQAETLSAQMNVVYAFTYRGLSLGPSQIASELMGFLETVQSACPRAIVEIGTGLGGTTVLLTRAAADDAVVVSVDLPRGQGRERLVAAAARPPQSVHCLRADSHAQATRNKVEALLRGRQVDLLFIDGDHSAEGVRVDLALYSPLLRPGGWIAFHDIVPGPYEFVGGVPELWAELKEEHETREFVADWAQGGLGIGAFST